MPNLSRPIPKYRCHRPTGQAVVTVGGKDVYLGPFRSKASRLEYDRVIAEWLIAGRPAAGKRPTEAPGVLVIELLAAYKTFAESYYRKNGVVTNEVDRLVAAMNIVRQLFGRLLVEQFGPNELRAVQSAMIEKDWCRPHINKQISRVLRVFSWGVSHNLTPPDVIASLREVPGLKKNRCTAREPVPVTEVSTEIVDRTLPHLPPIVADMVRFQRLTGARPEEVCLIRPADLDTAGPVWEYIPSSHKMEHKDRARAVFIGPQAQEVLRPYLNGAQDAYCFSPQRSETQRRRHRHQHRKTPSGHGNRPGTNRVRAPRRSAGERYTTASYRRAIQRAAEKAFPLPSEMRDQVDLPDSNRQERRTASQTWRKKYVWSPNQLRHSAATEIRRRFGLEAAQVILGHASADVTQVYAERDRTKAIEVMARIG